MLLINDNGLAFSRQNRARQACMDLLLKHDKPFTFYKPFSTVNVLVLKTVCPKIQTEPRTNRRYIFTEKAV